MDVAPSIRRRAATDDVVAPPHRNRRWRRALVLLAALWLVFVAAHLILNGRWWFWLLPSALPPILFVVIPVLLLIAATAAGSARRLVVVPALVSLALTAQDSGIHLSALRTGGSSIPAGALRVFSWNTEYWHQEDDPAAFYRYLHSQRADVYLLQEYVGWDLDRPFDGERPLDDLTRLRAEFPGHHIATRGELVTLSRFPIVAQPPVSPDPAASGDRTTEFRRVFRDAKVLRTDLRIGAATVSFYNVHIAVQLKIVSPLSTPFYTFPRGADVQRRAQLLGLSADVATNSNPALVAGDFNTSPAMADLDVLDGRLRDAITADPTPYPATWPAGALALWRLDWVFASDDITVHRYGFRPAEGLSDHRAQALTVGLPG